MESNERDRSLLPDPDVSVGVGAEAVENGSEGDGGRDSDVYQRALERMAKLDQEEKEKEKEVDKKEKDMASYLMPTLPDPYHASMDFEGVADSTQTAMRENEEKRAILDYVIHTLRANGMDHKPFLNEDAEGMMYIVAEILKQYERRGELVKKMANSTSENVVDVSNLKRDLNSIATERAQTAHALERAITITNEMKAKLTSQTAKFIAEKKAWERQKEGLRHKVSHAQHAASQKEREIMRLRERLVKLAEKDESRVKRDSSAFSQMAHRSPSSGGVDARTMQVISQFNSYKDEAERELSAMRNELQHLHRLLAKTLSNEAENEEKEKEKEEERSEISHQVEIAFKARDEAIKRSCVLREELLALHTAMSANEKEREMMSRKIMDLENNLIDITTELKLRPTTKQLDAEKKRIRELEAELRLAYSKYEAVVTVSAGSSGGSSSGDTVAQIKKDKTAHKLGVNFVSELPGTISSPILRDVCVVLGVSAIEEVVPSLQNVTAAVSSLPAIKKFIKEVTGIAESIAKTKRKQSHFHFNHTPAMTLEVLREWATDLHKLLDMSLFVRNVSNDLKSLKQLQLQTPLSNTMDLSYEQMSVFVKEMVEHENMYFNDGDEKEKRERNCPCSRLIKHYQKLHGITELANVVSSMNSVYQRVCELTSALAHIKTTLGLSSTASVTSVIQRIEEIEEKEKEKEREEK